LIVFAVCAIDGTYCACARGQEALAPPGGQAVPQQPSAGNAGAAPAPITPLLTDEAGQPVTAPVDSANLDGCQVVARIDDQIILACEVLWRVNQMIEKQKERMGPDAKVSEEEIDAVRKQLVKQQVAQLVDRKLLFNEFRRTVPPEALPRIEENLRQPFEQSEIPHLMKQLKVNNQAELEHELARLGSSLADERRAFNERGIAFQWLQSKVKINEDVSPDQMYEYYQAHLTDYDYPTQARWEELAVRKDRFKNVAEAYAEVANMGNEVWQRGKAQPLKGPAFAEVAKAKSDGATAKEGGEHRWLTKGALQCKELDTALFTLQVGQMSQIIDSGPMFHIVRVLERKEAGRKSYTDVQADIREKLKEERFQEGIEKYLTRLRGEARIWTVYTGHVSADSLLGRKPDETQQK
jgi:parvulin-like peptidyl-prolyl isomerase